MPAAAVSRRADPVLLTGFVGDTLPPWLADRLNGGLAGVCLFGANVTTRARLRALTDDIRSAHPRAVVAVDEEGGDVTRLHHATGSPYPGNAVLGRVDDLDLTRRVARTVGEELAMAGINLDLAPDVDVNSDPDNPVIGVRSFGADPWLVARHGAAWVEGLQSTGVAACAKHFPGHGDTATDSHLTLPVVDRTREQLWDSELVPFRASIDAGVDTVMSSHILLPQLDRSAAATFSPIVLSMLRTELGFDGVIVSDALDMVGASGGIGIPEAAVRALVAGCDLLCVGTDIDAHVLDQIGAAVDAAVRNGRLGSLRWATAVERVERLSARLARMPLPEYEERAAPRFDLERTRAVFEGAVPEPGLPILVLETRPNQAVGEVPWGLAAAGLPVQVLRPGELLPAGGPYLVVGRDNHLVSWTRDTIDALRMRHPSTVVVDLGWPAPDRAYADLVTFGASRHVGEALRSLLEQQSRGAPPWPRS